MSASSAVAGASTPSIGSAPPVLFADRGCPFAHRVLALLDHLKCPVELRQCMVGDKPEGLSQYSLSGSLPLLVHGTLVITESRVILEHLADYIGFREGIPGDLVIRTLHRHAMARVDGFLAPLLFQTKANVQSARLEDVLRELELAIATVAPRPSLMAFHVAPIWLRFRWWHPDGVVTRAVEAKAPLCAWLDAATGLDAVTRTAPDLAEHMSDLSQVRRAGLLR